MSFQEFVELVADTLRVANLVADVVEWVWHRWKIRRLAEDVAAAPDVPPTGVPAP